MDFLIHRQFHIPLRITLYTTSLKNKELLQKKI